ncbi:MAG TPA: hypothetical protein VFK06_10365 [Candidatus Angelobacter sp.]|nr:hypothetical protein [Candidatus Angelobacter sp.]
MAALLLAVALPLSGQVGPIEKHSVHQDVSAPLSEMIQNRASAGLDLPSGKKEAEKARRINLPPGLKPAEEPDSVLQQTVVSPGASLAAAQAPTSGLGFEGLGNASLGFTVSSAPPDTNGAAGLTQYVQWVNSSFAVFNKSTGALIAGPTAGNTLWSGFGGGCQTNNDGDPIVLYDKQANRWVFAQFSVTTTPFLQCVAVSTTSDATGTYNRYSFQYSNFDDYPKMGIWPDAYYTTFNMFNGNTFVGADLCAYDRNAMLNGQPATQVCFQQGSSVGGVLPADMEGTTPPPAGSPNFLLFFGTNNLNLFKFHVDFATPANSTITGPTAIPVAAFTPVCNGGTCVPQAGTTQQLDSLADRLMYRLSYRNFGSHESLVVNHSVAAGTGGGIRWYELQNPNGTVTVAQQSTFAPDSKFRWMGSIATDKAGDMAMGYSVSSSASNPSIAFTGRLVGDPPSTMQAESTIINGTGSQTGNLSRWGDYSAITLDPADDCTFWYTTEYMKTTGSFNWNTRIASFKFPGCGGGGTADYTLSASPSSLTVVQGKTGTSTITVNPTNGFTGSVSLSASGMPAGVTASFNPTSTTGSSTLTLTVSSTAATGTSTITITGTSGSLTHTTTVSLTVTSSAPQPQQLLGNPGFENGTNTAPWTLTSGVINNTASEPPHSGTWDAWLDGFGTTHTDTAAQTVTIPSTATSATLSFFLHIDTAETTTTTAFDVLKVQVLNTSGTVLATLGTFSNLNAAAGYQQHSFSVLNFKGQTVQIKFTGTEDASLQTSFVIDDTALNVQ